VEQVLRRRRHSAAAEFVDVRVVQQFDLFLADLRTELGQEPLDLGIGDLEFRALEFERVMRPRQRGETEQKPDLLFVRA